SSWYVDAAAYWSSVPSTVEGMLGGFGKLTTIDCKSSVAFVSDFFADEAKQGRPAPGKALACADCGAGIGRVSKGFLLKVYDSVDLVEQNRIFLEQGRKNFERDGLAHRVQKFVPLGLQDFIPEPGRYDAIWSQWVLGHLTDDDLVAFFVRCKAGLRPNGFIGVKENTSVAKLEKDEEDSSVTRTREHLESIFAKAGLQILKQDIQQGFPKGLFPVRMYILR
ncbi:alpha-N-methyltransferase NTM1, partial [Zopfochytrium polystomum]